MLRAEGLVPAGDGYPSELPVRVLDEDGDLRPLDDIEADLIRLAVNLYRGRMTEVARRLGIGRSTLYRRLKELGLEDEDRAA
jgi:transcriptional regulator of acetoin/glycerol metabolism